MQRVAGKPTDSKSLLLAWVNNRIPCRSQDGRKSFSEGPGFTWVEPGVGGYLLALRKCKITKFPPFPFLYAFMLGFAHEFWERWWGPERLGLETLGPGLLKADRHGDLFLVPQTYLLRPGITIYFPGQVHTPPQEENPGQVEVILWFLCFQGKGHSLAQRLSKNPLITK